MHLAKEFSVMLITNPSSLDPYPEPGSSANRIHPYRRGHRYFAKDIYLAEVFQCSQCFKLYLIIVTRKPIPKAVLYLNMSKYELLGGQTPEVWNIPAMLFWTGFPSCLSWLVSQTAIELAGTSRHQRENAVQFVHIAVLQSPSDLCGDSDRC